MRAVLQRVADARVTVGDDTVGAIDEGILLLLGIAPSDGPDEVAWIADKVAQMRIFPDDQGKMNRSLLDVGGEVLVVSQFTLYGDARKGRRPSFVKAAQGPEAESLYDEVVTRLMTMGVRCATGRFGAMMDVHLVNRGPVTILLDSERTF